MKNIVRKNFDYDGSWTCPAGVNQVRVLCFNLLNSQISGAVAIANGGDLYGWGTGNGNATITSSSPVLVTGGKQWREISSFNGLSGGVAIGIVANGDAYSYGSGGAGGQLGNGSFGTVANPYPVSGGLKWRTIFGGGDTSVGISANGQLYAWGLNPNGNLGDGTVVAKSIPTLCLTALRFKSCAASWYSADNAGAIDVNGNAYTWGYNLNGQLGLGDVIPRSSPVLVIGGKTYQAISMSGWHTLLLDTLGNAYTMGLNTSGQLGDGTVVPKSSPVLVLGGKKFKAIKAFHNQGNTTSSNLALTVDGDLYAWGNNASGQLGLGDVIPRSSPVLVGAKKWLQLGASEGAGFAMDSASSIYAWGYNGVGQLGTNDLVTVARSTPTIVSGGLPYGQAMQNILVNDSLISVVPGTTYPISIIGSVVTFDYNAVYQDPYNSGAVITKVVLEYMA